MKKLLLLILLVLTVHVVFAQKINIDKKTGILSIDKIDVGKVEELKGSNAVYKFTSLDGQDLLTMIELKDGNDIYFEVTASFNPGTTDMDYESVVFSLNARSLVSNLIIKKYNFFTSEGMNKAAINDFINRPVETRKEKFAKEQVEQQARLAARQEKLKDINPVIQPDNTIINGNTGEKLGSVVITARNFTKPSRNTPLGIKNEGDSTIAAVTQEISPNLFLVQAYNNKEYKAGGKDKDEIIKNIVEGLAAEGYFGKGENSMSIFMPLYRKFIDDTDPENTGRTDVDGILTLKNGSRIEGKFRVIIRQPLFGIVRKNNLLFDLDGASGITDGVTYVYTDEKGKSKSKKYKFKEFTSFEIINDSGNKVESYDIISVERPKESTGNDGDLLQIASVMSRSKNIDLFAWRAAETPEYILYYSEGNWYRAGKGDGQVVLLENTDPVIRKSGLSEDCLSALAKIQNGAFAGDKTLLTEFLKEYNSCMK
jgi:hypothetical protein